MGPTQRKLRLRRRMSGAGQAPLAESVLHLFPAETSGVDDLPRIAGENHRAGIRRQAEKERDLDVGEVLDLIADHEIPRRCSRVSRLSEV